MYFIRKFNPEIHHRKSIRLRGYDYTRPGMYFITIVTCQGCKIMFGVKTNGKIILNEIGEIVQDEWLKTPIIRCNVKLDEFIVMPDHFHGIIALFPKPSVGATGMENNTTVGATGMENNTTGRPYNPIPSPGTSIRFGWCNHGPIQNTNNKTNQQIVQGMWAYYLAKKLLR